MVMLIIVVSWIGATTFSEAQPRVFTERYYENGPYKPPSITHTTVGRTYSVDLAYNTGESNDTGGNAAC